MRLGTVGFQVYILADFHPVYPHIEDAHSSLSSLFYESPTLRTKPKPSHLPKVSFPNTIILAGRVSTYQLREGNSVQNIPLILFLQDLALTVDFPKNFFYWRVVALQCHISFTVQHSESATHTYSPSFLDFLPM